MSVTGSSITGAGSMPKWDLLWTNASPNSSFAPQTVSINLSGYNFVMIEYYDFETTDTWRALHHAICIVGGNFTLLFGWNNNRNGTRSGSISSSGVYFNGCSYNSAANNARGVPVRIYGINGIPV